MKLCDVIAFDDQFRMCQWSLISQLIKLFLLVLETF